MIAHLELIHETVHTYVTTPIFTEELPLKLGTIQVILVIMINFHLVDNVRSPKLTLMKRQNYEVGTNILLNRMYVLYNKIDKSCVSLSIKT